MTSSGCSKTGTAALWGQPRPSGKAASRAAIESMRRLETEFAGPGLLGPSSYVRFMAPDGALADERLQLARQAAGAVSMLIAALQGGQ